MNDMYIYIYIYTHCTPGAQGPRREGQGRPGAAPRLVTIVTLTIIVITIITSITIITIAAL